MIAVITGGTRGIGRAVAERLARMGANKLYLGYVQNDGAAAACAREIGIPVELVRANIGDDAGVEAFVGRVREDVDVFVHAAALGAFKPLMALKPNQWDLTMNVCARSFALMLRGLRDRLSARHGRVVAISSLGASKVLPGYGAIGAAKAALEAVVRYAAQELAPSGVRVNAIAVGLIDSPVMEILKEKGLDLELARRLTPMGRLGRAEDIAAVVEFLVGDLAEWVCGQTLVVDGGLSLV